MNNGNLDIHVGLSGLFSDFKLRNRSDGRIFDLGLLKPNLITEAGLDMPASHTWEGCFTHFMWGDGEAPAVYADTKLQNQLGSSTVYSGTENGMAYSLAEHHVELFRTIYATNTSGAAIPVREFSVSPDGTTAFNRVVLDADLSWPNNYDLLAKYTLRLNLPQWRNPTATTLTIGNQSVPGKMMIAQTGTDTSSIDNILCGVANVDQSTGGAKNFSDYDNDRRLLEPSETFTATDWRSSFGVISTSTKYAALSASSSVMMMNEAFDVKTYPITKASYAAGNHYVDRQFTLPPADFYGATLYGFSLNHDAQTYDSWGNHYSRMMLIFRATAGFTHPQTAQWLITQRLSWGRA